MSMTTLDAHTLLEHFLALAAPDGWQTPTNPSPRHLPGQPSEDPSYHPNHAPAYSPERHHALTQRTTALENVLDQVLPTWRHSTPTSQHDPWHQHRQAARQALLLLHATAIR